jgi:hypothetical protein
MFTFFFWRSVDSSSIKRIAWHRLGGGTLAVQFQSGATYRYNNVPRWLYGSLMKAYEEGESLGSAFHYEVKRGGYEYALVS